MTPDAHKVLIYATWRGLLLVFDEPDFPEIDLQVPGGTMEPGESPEEAARREFSEETGLTPPDTLTQFATQDYRYAKGNREICHRRHHFHVALEGEHRHTWLHHELTPDSGGAPIRFRFFWLSPTEAVTRLGYGMQEGLEFFRCWRHCPAPRV